MAVSNCLMGWTRVWRRVPYGTYGRCIDCLFDGRDPVGNYCYFSDFSLCETVLKANSYPMANRWRMRFSREGKRCLRNVIREQSAVVRCASAAKKKTNREAQVDANE